MNLGKKWLIFVGGSFIFGILSFSLPQFGGKETANIMVSVTGILFGLLSSFFISEMWGKYTSIRKMSGEFKGSLLMLIDSVGILSGNEDFKDDFEDKMEKYLIAYHVVPWHKVEEEQEYFQDFIDTVEKIEVNNDKDLNTYLKILTTINQLRRTRNKMINSGKSRLLKMEWTVILTLTGIFIVSLFALRDGSFLLNLLSTVLPSIALLIILFLNDLNKVKWNEEYISYEPGEAGLEALGKKRFYDSKLLERKDLNVPEGADYRTEKDLEGELLDVYEEFTD